MELREVPAGNLADHVVEGRFEEGRGGLGDGVLEFEEPVAHAQLGGHESQGIAGGLAGERRRTAQAGIDLDDAIVFALGVEGVLHVALAHDADVADDLDGQGAELVILGVGERLRGGYHNRLAGMNAEGVEVFHVADGDAVVVAVAHHLVFNLLPALERFFDEHLGREREGFLGQPIELFLIVAETGAQSAQGVGGTYDDGIAEVGGCMAGLLNGFAGLALDGLHADLVEPFHEEFAVFGVHDGLHGSA